MVIGAFESLFSDGDSKSCDKVMILQGGRVISFGLVIVESRGGLEQNGAG